MNKQRLEAERLIYTVMDKVDPSGKNKEYWINEFSNLTDEQFKKYISRPYWAFIQCGFLEKEPKMDDIRAALKVLKVPLVESVYMPYKYKNKDGKPLKTKPCLVLYLNIKRMKQLLTKKNKNTLDMTGRDMKTGQLTGQSKGGRVSDHEFESFQLSGLDKASIEMSRSRADSMEDKETMYNTIKNTGMVYLKDLKKSKNDSIAKNNLYAAFIGAQMMTSLVGEDYYTPYTLKDKQKKISRID